MSTLLFCLSSIGFRPFFFFFTQLLPLSLLNCAEEDEKPTGSQTVRSRTFIVGKVRLANLPCHLHPTSLLAIGKVFAVVGLLQIVPREGTHFFADLASVATH
jgi:hypothetical protein